MKRAVLGTNSMRGSTRGAVVAAALLATCLAGCASHGAGRVPGEFVELYDQALPSGVIEIELERSGALREIEADIPVHALPAAVADAVRSGNPGVVFTGAERELRGGREAWEVKFAHQGRAQEWVVDGAGNLVETERELRRDEVPAAVVPASERALPDSTLVSVEEVQAHRAAAGEIGTTYHVKRARDGASYKLVLTADGGLVRAVREQRAELEIPLRTR